jgi:2-oxoglutarate dehydrogenase E2 component (dihydrolipoamide succinyltransferase)
MPIIEFKMPKMGESISEATIINWLKSVGDFVNAEEVILEIATDKVDSEVPSPVSGVITEIRFQKDDVVGVGEVLAIINSEVGSQKLEVGSEKVDIKSNVVTPNLVEMPHNLKQTPKLQTHSDSFLSPLIISIAQKENLSIEELQNISGSGAEGRIQKSDVFNFLKNRKYPIKSIPIPVTSSAVEMPKSEYPKPKINFTEGKDSIVEMDRMRKMIADHMVYSKQTSPHVTSYIEVDVTDLVNWRNENKDKFQEKYNEKLTFTPLFVDAIAKAIVDFPMINVSVDGKKIIVHKDINIGMATALPNGNLIVPVVNNANEKSLSELAKKVNHLADSSRNNRLKPEEVQGSTFTISNVGTFGSLMGTPIINQPEVAILALGIIKKRPEVITTSKGDEIAIRSMMYLSLSFDHRVVDGFLGGSFLRKIGDYLESPSFENFS